jgi:CBS domain-containing membrane protein
MKMESMTVVPENPRVEDVLLVKDLMTTDLFTLYADDSLKIAEEIMGWRNIRHIPIINYDDEIVGIVTHRDILKYSISTLAEIPKNERDNLNSSIKMENIMATNMITVPENTPLYTAAKIIANKKIGCLPIVRGSKLVGIITEADFVQYFIQTSSFWPGLTTV